MYNNSSFTFQWFIVNICQMIVGLESLFSSVLPIFNPVEVWTFQSIILDRYLIVIGSKCK